MDIPAWTHAMADSNWVLVDRHFTMATSYANLPAWRNQMTFLPGNMQLTKPEDMPKEKTWRYKGHAVHVDSCGTPVGSPVTLVLLHGTVWYR